MAWARWGAWIGLWAAGVTLARAEPISSMVDRGCPWGRSSEDNPRCPPRALPTEEDPRPLPVGGPGMETGSWSIVVGTGEGPIPIVAGPIVITSVSTNCAVTMWLIYEDGTEAPVFGGGTMVPEGAELVIRDAGGFCQGTLTYSGYRPDGSDR